jgi:hypothetical protein
MVRPPAGRNDTIKGVDLAIKYLDEKNVGGLQIYLE